jgi:hypothetical protein
MLIKATLLEMCPIPKLVKGETVTTYQMKVKLKKASYEKDTENLKEGTGDPWTNTIGILSFDEQSFEEFEGLDLGSKILINITPAE